MSRGGKGKEKAVVNGVWYPPKKCAQLWVPKSENMNKKVLASFFSYYKQMTWIEIDPSSNCFLIDYDKINSDLELDLSSLIGYGTVVFNSKAYFIGGIRFNTARNKYDPGYICNNKEDFFKIEKDIYSSKMFVHDFTSKTCIESSSRLNIPRVYPTVILLPAQKLIYVFGGSTDNGFNEDGTKNTFITNKNHWGECFNLDDDSANWEYLDVECAPPDAVFKDYRPTYHFVYEKGNQIVFFMLNAGFYSFNYVSKTWAPFHCNLCKQARVKCFAVVVIDHLMFWHYYGVIYGYDLMKARLVLIEYLDQVEVKFATPPSYHGSWPEPSFLERVGNDTFVLVLRDTDTDDKQKDLHCYKFQVQNLFAYQQGLYKNLSLLHIGRGFFHSPGDVLENAFTI